MAITTDIKTQATTLADYINKNPVVGIALMGLILRIMSYRKISRASRRVR